MSLLAELQRRNVLRVAAAYVVTAWLIIQVAETLFPLFGFGDEPARITVLVALFVPALVLAWAFEWRPQGLKREEDLDRSVPADPRIGRRFDRAVMAVLALAVAYFALDKFVLATRPDAAGNADRPAPATEPSARAEPPRPVLAVLPFLATSLHGDSALFDTGAHEDLLTQLAQVESLRVISSTSVEEYRDTEKNLRQIGDELGATAILEGRVQSAGGRIRINMQLIDAADDQHLWAETYDRELSTANIFDVQAEIARAVAEKLQAALSKEDRADLRTLPTQNLAAYRAYHEALELRDRQWNASEEFRALLRKAIALDPGFTRPLAELVGSLVLGEALLAAFEGEREEAERLVRRWNREGATDWPDRVALRDMSCRILGMAGAGEAAVECLRTGLEEPSMVLPFLDPYLPWYDGIREEPAFVALVAELEAAWPQPGR